MGLKPMGLMKEEAYPTVTRPSLLFEEIRMGGAVLKGRNAYHYYSIARALPSTRWSDPQGRGKGKGMVRWWFA